MNFNHKNLPLFETEFPLTPFYITPFHYPLSPHPYIPDPSYIDPILLRNINEPQSRKSISIPTIKKGRRRHSQLDPSLPLPKPCIHSQSEISLPPPKLLTIPAFESVDTLSEKYPLSDIDSTTFSFIYPRFLPSNSASKHTTSSLDSFLETSSESTICRTPRHTYNLRYSRNPTLSLASTNSSLVRNLALFPHTKNFSPLVLTLLFSTLLFFFL